MSCLGVYLTVAALLDFKYLVFPGDANARMANGFYVLYSNDPHVASIGFTWNPLQSIADIVPLLFKDLWPALATNDVAASLVSVLCMVGAVHQVHAALREWQVPRGPRLLIVAIFALNPMILFYAGNGMSEGLYLFTLLATCRYLARWLRTDDVRSLGYAATALGLCYLTRIEAVGPALFAGVLVFAVAYSRFGGPHRARMMAGVTDGTVFLFPFIMSFVGWAVAGYVITGQAFSQLTTQYGTAQISAAGYQKTKLVPGLKFEGRVLEYLGPLLPLIVVGAAIVAWRRRDALMLVIVSVCGGALVFDLAAYLNGGIIDSYRYFIATLPLEVLLVGSVLAAPPPRSTLTRPGESLVRTSAPNGAAQRSGSATRRRGFAFTLLGMGVALVVLGPSIPATAAGMFNPKIGSEESTWLGFVVHGLEHHQLTPAERANKSGHAYEVALGDYIARLHLPHGDVLVDNFDECITALLTSTSDPKVFVIPNDRDFKQVLDAPLTFHAHYLLVAPTTRVTAIENSIDQLYPTLYATGAGFANLVHQYPALGGNCPAYRLYRLVRNPGDVASVS
jgi:hypothetical protein